jgi:hypothetical protein
VTRLKLLSKRFHEVRFEVFTAVSIGITVFLELTPCHFVDEYQFTASIFRIDE